MDLCDGCEQCVGKCCQGNKVFSRLRGLVRGVVILAGENVQATGVHDALNDTVVDHGVGHDQGGDGRHLHRRDDRRVGP